MKTFDVLCGVLIFGGWFMSSLLLIIINVTYKNELNDQVKIGYNCNITEIVENCPIITIKSMNKTIIDNYNERYFDYKYKNENILRCVSAYNKYKLDKEFKCYNVNDVIYTKNMIEDKNDFYNFNILLGSITLSIFIIVCLVAIYTYVYITE